MEVFGQKCKSRLLTGAQIRMAGALQWLGIQSKCCSRPCLWQTEVSFPTKPLSALCKPSRNKCLETRLEYFLRLLTQRGFELLLFRSPWVMAWKVPSIFESDKQFWFLTASWNIYLEEIQTHNVPFRRPRFFSADSFIENFSQAKWLPFSTVQLPTLKGLAGWGQEHNRLATSVRPLIPSTAPATSFHSPSQANHHAYTRNDRTPNSTSTSHTQSPRVLERSRRKGSSTSPISQMKTLRFREIRRCVKEQDLNSLPWV